MKLQKIPSGLPVFAGGGSGVLLRWGIGEIFPSREYLTTFTINVLGSLFLGFLLGLLLCLEENSTRASIRWGLGTGLLGGFTTYSSFAVQAIELIESGSIDVFLLYSGGTLLAAIICCWVGMLCAEYILRRVNGKGRPDHREVTTL